MIRQLLFSARSVAFLLYQHEPFVEDAPKSSGKPQWMSMHVIHNIQSARNE